MLLLLPGCSRDADAVARAAAEPTRERRLSQLLRLAEEVGAPLSEGLGRQRRPGRRQHPGSGAGAPAAQGDAGAQAPATSDAGGLDAGELDAGAAPPAPVHPGVIAAADAGAPAPLPRDIVAQSALPLYGLEAGVVLPEPELWARLAASRAVCFGEFHDVAAHHYAEAEAIAELAELAARDGSTLAVGFEMFQRPFQAPLDAFVAGELGEDELLAQTEYATRWGYDFSLYRPLLEQARSAGSPALALNARAELTRKIGRTGLESLDAAELAELPELVLDDAEHRQFIFGLFGVTPEEGVALGLENIYVAQTTWDETMAETAARWLLQAGSPGRLLAFAGGAHCHRSAIPRRLARRIEEPVLAVHAVFQSELADGSFTPEGYDLLVVLDD